MSERHDKRAWEWVGNWHHPRGPHETMALLSKAIGEAEREGMRIGYLAGFNASGEGWNGEYPFSDDGKSPLEDADWVGYRDRILAAAITP